MSTAQATGLKQSKNLNTDAKLTDIRINNIIAAKALSDVVRTSLGPRGMDKMVRYKKRADFVDPKFKRESSYHQ